MEISTVQCEHEHFFGNLLHMSTQHTKDLTCEHTPDFGWFAGVADLFDVSGVDITILVAAAIDDTNVYPGAAGCQGADFTQRVVDHHLYPSTDLDPIITDPELVPTTDPGPRTQYAVFVHIDSLQLQLCSLSNTEISHRMKTEDLSFLLFTLKGNF